MRRRQHWLVSQYRVPVKKLRMVKHFAENHEHCWKIMSLRPVMSRLGLVSVICALGLAKKLANLAGLIQGEVNYE